jgi:5-methylcytosine-specific restriction protein B
MTEYPVHEEYRDLIGGADAVLRPGLTGGPSPFDPSVVTWTAQAAEQVLTRVRDNPDKSSRTFLEKLTQQLVGADRATILLCAELLYLQSLPLGNVGPHAKRARVEKVLGFLPDRLAIPEALEVGWSHGDAFHGGVGFNTRLPHQLIWLAEFVQHWAQLPQQRREAALADPVAFGEVAGEVGGGEVGIRRSLCFLAWPGYYEPIVNTAHRTRLRDAFASYIGGATGDSDAAVSADLYAIRREVERRTGSRAHWYQAPLRAQWQPEQATPDEQRAWLVRAKDPQVAADWLASGYVSHPATYLGPVPVGADKRTIRAAVEAGYQHLGYVEQMEYTNALYDFMTRMQVGAIVMTVSGESAHVGLIDGDAQFHDGGGDRLRRPVDWLVRDLEPGALPEPIPALLDAQGRVVDMTAALEGLRALLPADSDTQADEPAPPTPASGPVALPAVTDAAAARLHMPAPALQEIVELLASRRQVVLYGPPGTGKTYLALALARHLVGEENASHQQLVQFHPSYSYEDFFEGFRPAETDAGQATFRIQPGPLRQIATEAARNPGLPFVLVIDEMNRANLAKVFGELYFLLEYRKQSVRLQYSPDEAFRLPANLYLIGTMNTADRSIALLDAAMRRRFAFVELHPDEPPVRDVLANYLAANHRADDPRAALLAALNAAIEDTDRDFKIGPSYLMRPEAADPAGLQRIWRHDILPLLEEHYYGRLNRAQVHERFGLDSLRVGSGAPAEQGQATVDGEPAVEGVPAAGPAPVTDPTVPGLVTDPATPADPAPAAQPGSAGGTAGP